VKLLFSSAVEWVKNGVSRLVNEIDAMLGEVIDWRPLIGARDNITIQTIFMPEGTLTNQTGFASGYNVDIDALHVDTGFGDLGLIDVATLNENAAIRLPAFFNKSFDINLPQIALNPVTLNVVRPVLATLDDVSFFLSNAQELENGQYRCHLSMPRRETATTWTPPAG
jgi:hypothetical protein